MKKWKKRSLLTISVMLSILLLSFFIRSIDYKYIDKSSYADWISAFCNVVMATVAVIALIKAKQIWDDKGKDVGHKYAMELLTEVVPTMYVSSSTLYGIKLMDIYLESLTKVYDAEYSSLSEEIDNKRGFIKDMLSLIQKMKSSSIDEMNGLNDKCNNLISQFNMSGVYINDSIAGVMLKAQVEKYNEYTRQLMDFCYEINSALHFFKSPNIYNMNGGNYVTMDDFMDIINQEHLKLAISRFEILMELDEKIKDNLRRMKEGKYKSSDYFKF